MKIYILLVLTISSALVCIPKGQSRPQPNTLDTTNSSKLHWLCTNLLFILTRGFHKSNPKKYLKNEQEIFETVRNCQNNLYLTSQVNQHPPSSSPSQSFEEKPLQKEQCQQQSKQQQKPLSPSFKLNFTTLFNMRTGENNIIVSLSVNVPQVQEKATRDELETIENGLKTVLAPGGSDNKFESDKTDKTNQTVPNESDKDIQVLPSSVLKGSDNDNKESNNTKGNIPFESETKDNANEKALEGADNKIESNATVITNQTVSYVPDKNATGFDGSGDVHLFEEDNANEKASKESDNESESDRRAIKNETVRDESEENIKVEPPTYLDVDGNFFDSN